MEVLDAIMLLLYYDIYNHDVDYWQNIDIKSK